MQKNLDGYRFLRLVNPDNSTYIGKVKKYASKLLNEKARNQIVGQWRSVVTNYAHKNTLAKRYMRHSFFSDGTVVVESESTASIRKRWIFEGGIYIVSHSYQTSKFVEHFKLVSNDELVITRFKSVINGENFADYNPKDIFIRQGSSTGGTMTVAPLVLAACKAAFVMAGNCFSHKS